MVPGPGSNTNASVLEPLFLTIGSADFEFNQLVDWQTVTTFRSLQN
jgi:hypothetical protein